MGMRTLSLLFLWDIEYNITSSGELKAIAASCFFEEDIEGLDNRSLVTDLSTHHSYLERLIKHNVYYVDEEKSLNSVKSCSKFKL